MSDNMLKFKEQIEDARNGCEKAISILRHMCVLSCEDAGSVGRMPLHALIEIAEVVLKAGIDTWNEGVGRN
jgi:hypothetical protein